MNAIMTKIKVAIAGLGNCASSLIQGIYFYSNKTKEVPGLLHNKIGSYYPKNIEIVAAFDIDERKVGLDVSKAIFAKPNNTPIFYKNIPNIGVKVMRAPTLDGYSSHMTDYDESIRFLESKERNVDVEKILRIAKPDILINYLPVGSQKATEYYVNCCLNAGVSFINAIPVFICSKKEYIDKFKEKNLVCIGDDIKSQIGSTIVHRVLANLFKERGAKIINTYQLNVGGNTDFLNMLDRKRLKSKKISKTEAVKSELPKYVENSVHIGPSDYIPFLNDNKIAYIKIDGVGFGGLPIVIDLKLSVIDSPNSAGIMIDVIRCAKLAIDRGIFGYLEEISSYGFKHPLKQTNDYLAKKKLNAFIKG